jgi:cell division protein FtsA
MKKNITVGLDIGTSKVCALVASTAEDGSLEILGIGITESEGLNRGVVVNIERTVKTIKKVLEQAEQQSGVKINEVVVGIAGDHIEAIQTRAIVGISNPNQEVQQSDVDRLLVNARNLKIPAERQIIHVLPQEFIIDGQDGITDPIGMSGVRMEADVHIITGLNTAIKNIHTCVERAGIKVQQVVLEPFASSRAILTQEEKEVGVALIDIGGGTTDIAVFEENVIRFTSIFGIAGKHVTDDVRKCLGVIANQAERVKREFGHCFEAGIMKDEIFMIPGISGRPPMEVAKIDLCKIIEPRMEEIFEFAFNELNRSGYLDKLGAGIVVTGGTCLLKGTEDLARRVFGMPVKLGIPTGVSYSGLAPEVESPVYSTAVGLALFGLESENSNSKFVEEKVIEKVEEVVVEKKEKKIFKKSDNVEKSEIKNTDENTIDDKPKSKVSLVSKIKEYIENL